MTRHRAAILCLILALAGITIFVEGPWRWRLYGLASAAYLVVLTLGVSLIGLEFFGRAVCRGPAGKRRVALTFDDGPNPTVTPQVLKALRRLGVPATFFCLGERVLDHPDLARSIVAQGHLMGNHSHRHQWWLNFRGRRFMLQEIRSAQQAILSTTGTVPRYYRPPAGLTNPQVGPAARALELQVVGWTARGFDQFTASPSAIVRRIVRRTTDGSIIVLHDCGLPPERLLAVVEELVSTVRQSGLEFVRLDQLLEDLPGKSEPPGQR